jgi:hypothetical protein
MATRHRHNVLPKVLRNDVEIPGEPTASLKMVTKTVNKDSPKQEPKNGGVFLP